MMAENEPAESTAVEARPIFAEGVAPVRDYGIAYMYHYVSEMRWPFLLLAAIFLTAVEFTGVLVGYQLLRWQVDWMLVATVCIFGVVNYFVFIRGYVQGWRINRQIRALPDTTWRFLFDRLEVHDGVAETIIRWDGVVSAKLMKRRVMLYIAGTGGYNLFVPGMFASAADWQAFRILVRVQKGNCERCDYPLKGIRGEACPECGALIEPPQE